MRGKTPNGRSTDRVINTLDTVDVLKPEDKSKKHTNVDLHRLRASYSLKEGEMIKSLPNFHKKMLSEGCTNRGAKAVLTQELRPLKKVTT